MSQSRAAQFAVVPEAANRARHFVRETLTEWGKSGEFGLESVLDDALLLTSELVTNAVVHAGTAASVQCELRPGADGVPAGIRVEVADRHPSKPLPALAGPETTRATVEKGESEHGYGLYLISYLADAWGVQYSRGAKQVWFELRLPGGDPGPADALPPVPAAQAADDLPPWDPHSIEELDEHLRGVAEHIRNLFEMDSAVILLAEDDAPGTLRLRAAAGVRAGSLPPVTQSPSAASRIDLSAFPAVYPDLAGPGDHSSALVAALAELGLRSLATAPLAVGGRTTGLIAVADHAPGRFGDPDALRLAAEAERIALTVETARLAEAGQSRRAALSFLAEAGELLAGSLDPERTLALAAQLLVPSLARWCAIYRRDETGREKPALVWHADEEMYDALAEAVRASGEPEPGTDGGLWPATAADALRPGELLVLPLEARGRPLGTIALATQPGASFARDAADLAWDLARRISVTYDAALSYAELRRTANLLQASLLPPEIPRVAGADIAVFYHPAGQDGASADRAYDTMVGGDFYDVFEIRQGCWGLAIGDVCGTGPQAAAVTGLARHALRLLAREGLRPSTVIHRLNQAILDEGERGRFLTLVYAEAEPQPDGSLSLALICAGHPPPLILRAGGVVEISASSQPLLGVIDGDPGFHIDTVVLRPGDALLGYTDGASERRGAGRVMLGDEGMARMLADCKALSAAGITARIQRGVEQFGEGPLSDDMALLALKAAPIR
ncbi:SpoIIE family protein phosphatase [Actinospica sp.]|uniref:SpoIIE family protein phosphatase n=1 Tax=Actinospica sp. TaxID=1872142 RepID=UPI002CD8A6A4|nr:SpoIIE family protein phosphatase [Actinospica sp.]HWG27898.1 SpoIIE family protein phosphatase [Actinospica sp.]